MAAPAFARALTRDDDDDDDTRAREIESEDAL